MEVVMSFILWMWASASFGACIGFLLAAMLHVASRADDQEERWLNQRRDH
jgi:uncharacterized membrane protein